MKARLIKFKALYKGTDNKVYTIEHRGSAATFHIGGMVLKTAFQVDPDDSRKFNVIELRSGCVLVHERQTFKAYLDSLEPKNKLKTFAGRYAIADKILRDMLHKVGPARFRSTIESAPELPKD